jgi:hypothetical protein
MRKQYKRVEKIAKRIAAIELEIEATRTSQFYNEFSNEGDRFKDLTVLRAALRDAINEKTEAIDKLMHACEIEKQEMNNQLNELNIWKQCK